MKKINFINYNKKFIVFYFFYHNFTINVYAELSKYINWCYRFKLLFYLMQKQQKMQLKQIEKIAKKLKKK